MFFVIEFFLTGGSYQFLKNCFTLDKVWLTFLRKNIFYNSIVSNFDTKFFNGLAHLSLQIRNLYSNRCRELCKTPPKTAQLRLPSVQKND